MRRFWICVFNLALCLALVAGAESINNAGERISLIDHLEPGKIVVFDFYSDYCGPCHQMGAALEELDRIEDEIIVKKVNIDRPDSNGIDWDSPVAEQYGISSVPHLVIYRGEELIGQGESAKQFLNEYVKKYRDDE